VGGTCPSVPHGVGAYAFRPLPQPKLVYILDLATPKGSKAELTWVMVTSQDSLPARDGNLPQKIPDNVMTGIRTYDRESQLNEIKVRTRGMTPVSGETSMQKRYAKYGTHCRWIALFNLPPTRLISNRSWSLFTDTTGLGG